MLLAVRLFLCGVFALAGVAKLRDRTASRRALVDFGLGTALAKPFAVILPVVELAVALALLPASTALFGAIGALGLILLFTTAMAANIARGRRPNCQCFGQLQSAPIGWTSLARNMVLAALAAFIVVAGWADPGPGLVAWVARLTPFEAAVVVGGAVGLVLLAVQGARLDSLSRQNDLMLARLTGLPQLSSAAGTQPEGDPGAPRETSVPAESPRTLGAPAPGFSLTGLEGDIVTLDALRAPGLPVVLVFSDPGCSLCDLLLPEIGRWQREESARLTVAVISRGTPASNKAKATQHRLTRVLLQRDNEVSKAYGVMGTPSAILIRPDGSIGSGMAQADASIRHLYVIAQGAPPPIVPAPEMPPAAQQPAGLPPPPPKTSRFPISTARRSASLSSRASPRCSCSGTPAAASAS